MPRPTYLLYLVVFLLMWGGCIAFRYKTGGNYLPVHVQVKSADGDDPGLVVLTSSPWGTVGRLQQDEHWQTLWRRADFEASPVSKVIIACNHDQLPIGVELILGTSLDATTRMIHVSDPGREVSVPEGVPAKRAYEFRPTKYSTSFISTPTQTMNWQGDAALLFICGLQALVICALMSVIRFAAVGCGYRVSEDSRNALKWNSLPTAMRQLLSFVFVCVFLILADQLMTNSLQGFAVSEVMQFTVGLVVCSVMLVIYSRYARWALQMPPDSVRCGVTFVVAFLLLKLVWLVSTDHFSSGDYGTYLKYGRMMVAGEWDLFPWSFPSTELMLKRSVFYTFPLAWFERYTANAIPIGNCFIETATLLVFYFYCRRCFGHRIATLSLPLLAVYPDCIFATPMASHDIPGMFWLIVCFYLVDLLRIELAWSSRKLRWARVLLLSVLVGSVIGLLELQRGYLTLVVAAAVIFCVFVYLADSRSVWSKLVDLRFWASAAAVIVCFTMASMLLKQVSTALKNTAPLPVKGNADGIVAYISGSRVSQSDDWTSMVPWRFVYYPAIPERNREETVVRKLLHEKVGCKAALWPHLWTKSGSVAGSMNYVSKLGGQVEGEMFPSVFWVPWFSSKRIYCCLVMSGLILCALWRLLIVAALPIQIGEVFPFCFCIISMAVILLLGEAAAQYDIFLAFPLAWCGGMVVRMWLEPQRAQSFVAKDHGSTVNAFLIGGALFAAVVAIHYAAGAYVDSAAWTFDRPVVLSKDDHAASGEWATSEISDASAFLSIPQSTVPPVGTKVSASFMTTHSYSDGQRIRFFVTGDQQRKKIWLDSEWVSYPVTFSVAVNGSEVAKGSLGELSKPLFIDQPLLNAKDRPAVISTTLVTEGVWSEGVPSIGIEYIH